MEFRTDMTPAQQIELDRALLIVEMDERLRAEGNGFCMGSADKARKTIRRYQIADNPGTEAIDQNLSITALDIGCGL